MILNENVGSKDLNRVSDSVLGSKYGHFCMVISEVGHIQTGVQLIELRIFWRNISAHVIFHHNRDSKIITV